MQCSVTYLDGKSSQVHPAVLHVLLGEVRVDDLAGQCLDVAMFSNVSLSAPLAGRDRYLKFAGGGRCQLADSKVLTLLNDELRSSPGLDLVHFCESSRKMVAVSSVALVLFAWLFIRFAIPVAALHIAMTTPDALMDSLSAEMVEMLDERFFAETTLSMQRQADIQELFQSVCLGFGRNERCELLFRHGGKVIGANAFALPSGQIIMTDECLELAESPLAIEGVMAHEMGHVQGRHAMRHALQHTGVFLLISALVGDIGSISSLATTLPILLVESGYSREFEEEADRVACLYLLDQGKTTIPYQDILVRMTGEKTANSSWFASHPETHKRVELMQQLAEKYDQ